MVLFSERLERIKARDAYALRLGKRIARLRRTLNISQAHLADVLGCHRNTVNRWESGGGIPDAYDVVALERFAASRDTKL